MLHMFSIFRPPNANLTFFVKSDHINGATDLYSLHYRIYPVARWIVDNYWAAIELAITRTLAAIYVQHHKSYPAIKQSACTRYQKRPLCQKIEQRKKH